MLEIYESCCLCPKALLVKLPRRREVTVMDKAGSAPADQRKEPAGYARVWPEHYQR